MKKVFKEIIILISLFIALIIALVIITNNKDKFFENYKITEYNIDSVILENGDLSVDEEITYKFNGEYNGIFRTLPYGNKINNASINDTTLTDNYYTNSGIRDFKIYVKENGEKVEFTKTQKAVNGDKNVYVENLNGEGIIDYRIYEPSSNETKTFYISYILENVAVKHLDVSELYWNFIGGEYNCNINKLNISINLPQNVGNSPIKTYIHGPASGKVEYCLSMATKFTYKNVKPGQYVASRLVFPSSSIPNSTKNTNMQGENIIKDSEAKLNKMTNGRNLFNTIIIILAITIFGYWIYLIVKYERDKYFLIVSDDELSLMKEYNPMIAACIVQERDMQPRDIIAVLINLVNKGALDLDVRKDFKSSKIKYLYKFSVKETFFNDAKKMESLDEIDKLVYEMFFNTNEKVIELNSKLKIIKKSGRALEYMKRLDNVVSKKLSNIGADSKKVPNVICKINNLLFGFVILIIIGHIAYNGVLETSTLTNYNYEYIQNMINLLIMILLISVFVLPIIMYIIYFLIRIFYKILNLVNRISMRISNKKLVQTLITYIIISAFVGAILIFFVRSYIIYDMILFMVSLLLILTDNLMASHDFKLQKDYVNLKMLENKLKDASLMKEKEIKDQKLWDEYLVYAIAFGVTDIEEYSKFLNITERIMAIALLNQVLDSSYYDMYSSYRTNEINVRLDSYKSVISSVNTMYKKAVESYNEVGGNSSHFGGGGFSGGGRIRWRRRCLLKKYAKSKSF